MKEKLWLFLCHSFDKGVSTRPVPIKLLVFPHRPHHKSLVEVVKDRIHFRWVIAPIIFKPSSQNRIVDSSEILGFKIGPISKTLTCAGYLPTL